MKHFNLFRFAAIFALALTCHTGQAQDKIELKTIQIKGNKELPKILYVVPWQETQYNKNTNRKLKLHDFFGDLYEPMVPAPPKMALDD